MAKLAIDRASIVFGKKKSGDFHSKSGDQEIYIILSKIGRSPEKSGDLEALRALFSLLRLVKCDSHHLYKCLRLFVIQCIFCLQSSNFKTFHLKFQIFNDINLRTSRDVFVPSFVPSFVCYPRFIQFAMSIY